MGPLKRRTVDSLFMIVPSTVSLHGYDAKSPCRSAGTPTDTNQTEAITFCEESHGARSGVNLQDRTLDTRTFASRELLNSVWGGKPIEYSAAVDFVSNGGSARQTSHR
jgi:hypothetical protein